MCLDGGVLYNIGEPHGCHISSIPRIPGTLITDRLIRTRGPTSIASDPLHPFFFPRAFGASSLSQIAARWPRAPVNKRLSSDARKNRIHRGRLVSPFLPLLLLAFSSLTPCFYSLSFRSFPPPDPPLLSAPLPLCPFSPPPHPLSPGSSPIYSSFCPLSDSLFLFFLLFFFIFFFFLFPYYYRCFFSRSRVFRRDAPRINYKKSAATRIGNVVPRSAAR